MIGQRLTMLALIERNTASGAGNWGQPPEPVFTPHATLACFAWSPDARDVTDGKKVAGATDVRVMFPLGADVRDQDEIAQITSKAGTTLFAGRLRVDGPVQFKHTHLEANLKRIG